MEEGKRKGELGAVVSLVTPRHLNVNRSPIGVETFGEDRTQQQNGEGKKGRKEERKEGRKEGRKEQQTMDRCMDRWKDRKKE